MFNQTFYHKTLRKNVILFGTLFNDIYINRVNNSGVTIDTLKVPISYGPKEKTLARVNQDPDLNKPFQTVLPRMAFEMTGMSYDNQRKLPTIRRHQAKEVTVAGKKDTLKYIYNPVPYNISFSLYIMVRNAEDGTRIVEQILPYFAPEWTATVNLIDEMDIALDIPTIINNVGITDTYEGSVQESRTIIWTLNFTMKTYLFGPIKRQSIIKIANVNFFDATTGFDADLNAIVNINTRPGLTANGLPTTNAQATVTPYEIDPEDNYDFIITKTDLYER